MINKISKKTILIVIIFFIAIITLIYSLSNNKTNLVIQKDHSNYPRLANYFLDWDVLDSEIPQLAKWDVLVLSPQAEERNPKLLSKLKKYNPNIKILVYQLTQESSPFFENEKIGSLARESYDYIVKNDWWLYDVNKNFVSLWPTNRIINITQENTGWVDYVINFVGENYFSKHKEYDGVFYDNVWYDITWLPDVNLDLNNDQQQDDQSLSDKQWFEATKKILEETHKKYPDKIIMGNVNFDFYNNYINGKTFENFGRNQQWGWDELMYNYWYNTFEFSPKIVIVNENTSNLDNSNNYQQMRFGLTSTLLSDGYYSYDIGDCCHNSIWWYDEYEVNLGSPKNDPEKLYYLLGKNVWKKSSASIGVWKREFENGIVLVNATKYKKTIILDKKYTKINGTQDKNHNDGSITNIITLAGNDGIILLK